ncbi:uncharacterized protein BX664DRAFT_332294 [Halteromyces radiatus]|uniref:uncharacterized protein n=1 Tax=Halteromyces radiatus TaxID=101107 RepID=UPI00221FCD92|nr:uncharacterized protein BX664DRAFT_332294 [Halteromyces radiatus]KAI8089146.1 hypothetical protein BX664DRAFT_332294 [Halteromyces radiatus]
MKKFHFIQYLHFWNGFMGLILTGVLIGVAANIKKYVNSGAEIAGFGNFNVFVYPATFVYMFIPAITSFVYGIILALDPSPQHPIWIPSKTLSSSIACVAGALLFASIWPVIPGADVMTAPDAAISCSWKDYMSWYTIYADPVAFPWVTSIDTACSCFTASVGLSWIVTLGWACQAFIYLRKSILGHRQAQPKINHRASQLSERSMKTMDILNNNNNSSNKYQY